MRSDTKKSPLWEGRKKKKKKDIYIYVYFYMRKQKKKERTAVLLKAKHCSLNSLTLKAENKK